MFFLFFLIIVTIIIRIRSFFFPPLVRGGIIKCAWRFDAFCLVAVAVKKLFAHRLVCHSLGSENDNYSSVFKVQKVYNAVVFGVPSAPAESSIVWKDMMEVCICENCLFI
jgi:hypothetical protein